MVATTSTERRATPDAALSWRDGHALDPQRWPDPIGDAAGTWVATVRGVEVEVQFREQWWCIAVAGEWLRYGLVRDLAGATGRVEAALRACEKRRSGESLACALAAELNRRGRLAELTERVGDALDSIEAASDWSEGPAEARPSAFARALRLVLAEAARRGFVATGRGEVVETWRTRARRRWLDVATLVGGRAEADLGSSFVRIEAGRVLEVFSEDSLEDVAADAAACEWAVKVDGARVGTITGRDAAFAYAVRRAKEEAA